LITFAPGAAYSQSAIVIELAFSIQRNPGEFECECAIGGDVSA